MFVTDHGALTVNLLNKHLPRAGVVISPGNPSAADSRAVPAIAECAEKRSWIVADEIYEKLIYGAAEHVSIASLSDEIKMRTIIVNGVSKTYAMTGWRIGYTASEPKLAAAMNSIQSHLTSNPNSIAQKAALAALQGPQECVVEMRRVFDERRIYMCERILQMPLLSCREPQGAFYLFVDAAQACGRNFRGNIINDAYDLAALLLEHYRVAVVPGRGFAPHFAPYATSLENIREGLTGS